MDDVNITELKDKLEKISQAIAAAEKEKNRKEARLDSLREQREREIGKLENFNVSSPKDLGKVMDDISEKVEKILDKISKLKKNLPPEVARELNGSI